ncbi:hypothetical protein WL80_30655 [Burkholderia ubonensis]|nr:hypothetical protein WL80_30655 [Burkholderia ubonensis]
MHTAHRIKFDVVANVLVNQIRVIAKRASQFVERCRTDGPDVGDDIAVSSHAGDRRTASRACLFFLRKLLKVNLFRRAFRALKVQLGQPFDCAIRVESGRHFARNFCVVLEGVAWGHGRQHGPQHIRLRQEFFSHREGSCLALGFETSANRRRFL